MALKWYVVHAYSGYEQQVMRTIQERVKRFGLEDQFGEILVPTEEVVEMRDGQKRKSDRKFFPGYVLVEMEMDDDSWHLVKDCPKVMGFIGGTSDKPTPITEREAQTILNRIEEGAEKPRVATGRARSTTAVTIIDVVAAGETQLASSSLPLSSRVRV